ncbi:MAG TPA: hypothetical protein DCG37_03005 [Lachnospiraceae bacterium]|nr:hypothetical protein [Lachnospiraceae bacterium]
MKKKLIVVFTVLVMLLGISACGSSEEAAVDEPDVTTEDSTEEPQVDGTAYGYGGSDPVEAAVYKYMAEEVSRNYSEAEIHIPTVNIIHIDFTPEDEILVNGDFWIENYTIDGDTLKCVSGGHHPGVIHMNKNYDVTAFDQVEDGEGFEDSAKELFGEEYGNFMKIYSDSDSRNELRKVTVSDYVKLNGLKVTQYQDEGWDPVELYH